MKTLLYCHHSLGLGHLMRTLRLAEAFLDLGQVAVICGGEMPRGLVVSEAIELQCLPPVSMNLDGKLYDPNGRESADALLERRANIVSDLATDFSPDALIVEMFPFGRKKFTAEVLSLIRNSRASGDAIVVCSVRDILVTTREDQAAFDRRAVDTLNREFDALLVHADASFMNLRASLSNYDAIEIPIHYTGYIAPPNVHPGETRDHTVVVSAGGGRVGRQIIETAAQASPIIKSNLGLTMTIVTGPLGTDCHGPCVNAQTGLKTVEFIEQFPQLLARTSLSISQCGYNTASDVLAAGTPAVFVPFETPQENEQLRRAERFATLDRSVTLREAALNVATLVEAAHDALSKPITASIDTSGTKYSADVVKGLVARG